jgi:hypothetical protein
MRCHGLASVLPFSLKVAPKQAYCLETPGAVCAENVISPQPYRNSTDVKTVYGVA